jgi:hypothetical protein
MTMTEKNHSPAGANPATSTTAPAPTVLDRMGGPKGFVYSTIPVVAFVAADAFLSLPAMITVAIAVALALTGYRLLHGEPFSAAIGGLVGLAAAVGIVVLTGSVFVIGIWVALAGFVATFGSVLARRPLTGVVWKTAARRYARLAHRPYRAARPRRRHPRRSRRARCPGRRPAMALRQRRHQRAGHREDRDGHPAHGAGRTGRRVGLRRSSKRLVEPA